MKAIKVDFEKLRDHARANRWTTQRIALESKGNVSQGSVSKVFSGANRNPSATRLKAICDVIGLPISEAFIDERQAA